MKWLVVCFLLTILNSCANKAIKEGNEVTTLTEVEEKKVAEIPSSQPGPDLNDQETDMARLPVEFNGRVTKWTEYFQGRGREHMKVYLARSTRYLPQMKEIFRKEGLPEDLVYIALIESGFKSSAYSQARATGYWQFMPSTGRRYGLQQNYYVDERRDYIKSTEAAAKYLKALYNLFGSWYLAIASYNVGENRIKNLVMQHYTRDFWELAKNRRLPKETEDYVPKFLAARLIAKHPKKYGFDDVQWETPLDYKEYTHQKGISLKTLAAKLGLDFAMVKDLNPAYLQGIIPYRKEQGAIVRLPSHLTEQAVTMAIAQSESSARMQVAGNNELYRIRSGDTLSHIAHRFRTSISAIKEANNLTSRALLYPGKTLKIPSRGFVTGASPSQGTKMGEGVSKPQAGEQAYTVQSGDSLYTIAKKFGTTITQLTKRNNLNGRALIPIGKVLIIPKPGASVKSKSRPVHVVQRGETLMDIANRYRVSLAQLLTVNDLKRRTNLQIGSQLIIPH